jgi:hypothetical protein
MVATKKKVGKKAGKNAVFLIITGGVLVTALVVCAILLLGNAGSADETQRVIELGTAVQGVTVGGIDISGMTKEEALAATQGLPAQMLEKVSFNVDVEGEQKALTAADGTAGPSSARHWRVSDRQQRHRRGTNRV